MKFKFVRAYPNFTSTNIAAISKTTHRPILAITSWQSLNPSFYTQLGRNYEILCHTYHIIYKYLEVVQVSSLKYKQSMLRNQLYFLYHNDFFVFTSLCTLCIITFSYQGQRATCYVSALLLSPQGSNHQRHQRRKRSLLSSIAIPSHNARQ